ncbi:MAG: RagB/SusD family nutrient uptake outer membrane protein [Chitinophagaceae bacterium]|nr:MAG: RagB/SusD family nutrient uptake outer membrane protein [Chitinophagaceae bacterium]
MKNILLSISMLSLLILFNSCSKNFLSQVPVAELSQDQILDSANVEGSVIAAYSVLGGQFNDASNAYNSPASNWSFGDVVSDDCYKGGGGPGDQNGIQLMELFQTNPSVLDVGNKWLALYEGVKRANLAIQLLNKVQNFDPALKAERIGEMRFLLGHYYFELKKIYNQIPYIPPTAVNLQDYYVSNTALSSDSLWAKIEEDFKDAYSILPMNQTEPGRPTKMAAEAYLCKTYIYEKKWADAEAAADIVINSGKYQLMNNFGDVFLPQNNNNAESVFAIQYSINDGSPNNYGGDIGDRLLPPGGPFYPLYGFQRPSQNLVNAFKTDSNGLPLEDNIKLNASDYTDPRLDYTVGRQGIPYLDLGINYDSTWERDLADYGPYAPKKRIVSAKSPYYLNQWPWVNALNYYVIRYADVLLWKAEAAIELGDLETGREYINMIRERAKNSQYIKTLDGSHYAANYKIDIYAQPFANQQAAIFALRTERRLEFALDGQRFFDIVRWGIADSVMNNYFATESNIRPILTGAKFIASKNEYFPIPQQEVDLGHGLIKQNSGY